MDSILNDISMLLVCGVFKDLSQWIPNFGYIQKSVQKLSWTSRSSRVAWRDNISHMFKDSHMESHHQLES